MNWNRYPYHSQERVELLFSRFDDLNFSKANKTILPYGNGRSYSDCCLNENNIVISTKKLNRFIAFDVERGLLTCEAGVTLADILSVCTVKNWFLPVLPGTQYVTLGGAIANDIHGKNHCSAGSFGRHVIEFELLRSDGQRYICSPHKNSQLFYATLGGLGLTGVILSATIQLKPIVNAYLRVKHTLFHSLDEFLELNADMMKKFEYTVAWMDVYRERGDYISAQHHDDSNFSIKVQSPKSISLPIIGHPIIFNRMSITCFNQLHFYRAKQNLTESIHDHYSFFFPLDKIKNWNRIYGKKGFLQYQCVIPTEHNYEGIKIFLKTVKNAKRKSSLMVVKNFGDKLSNGLLSFPKPGITIAMDFANPNASLLKFFDELDEIVMSYQGKVNPAKDARMSADAFKTFFPAWKEYANYMDPKFSSSFWKRVMPL